MEKKISKLQILAGLNGILVAAALVFSVISSNTAYRLGNIGLVIMGCAVTVLLDALVLLLGKKLPNVCVDAAFLATAVLTALALCTMIQGRVTLIGYIYFSDLESNNPVAISGMNLAICSWVLYALALVFNYIIGFMKHPND